MNYRGKKSAGLVCGVLALLLLASLSGCAGSAERSGLGAARAGGPPNFPGPIMHGYHPTTWRELPDVQAGSEMELSADSPLKTPEQVPAKKTVEQIPAPKLKAPEQAPAAKTPELAPPPPKRTGRLWRKIARGAETKASAEIKTDQVKLPPRSVARKAAVETRAVKPRLPLNAEPRSRQPSDTMTRQPTEIARAAVALGEAQGERIAAFHGQPAPRPERAIASTLPKPRFVKVTAALTPVTTRRLVDLVRTAKATPLSSATVEPSQRKTAWSAKRSSKSPPQQTAPAPTVWRPAPKRPLLTRFGHAPSPSNTPASRSAYVQLSTVADGPLTGDRVVQASSQTTRATPGPTLSKPTSTVRLITMPPRTMAGRAAVSQSTVAVKGAGAAPSDLPLRLPRRVVMSPASEIRVVRFLELDEHQPAESRITAPRPALHIRPNATVSGVAGGRSTIRLTVPPRQPSRRLTSSLKR